MKHFHLSPLALALVLGACGGGGGSSSTPDPTPAPSAQPAQPSQSTQPAPSSPPEPAGPQITVVAQAAQQNGLMQCQADAQQSTQFVEVTGDAGITYAHQSVDDGFLGMSGGVAAADFNQDGWVDLYAVGGQEGENALLFNNGDGTFSDVALPTGVSMQNRGSGPAFGDYNGDGFVDLFVGGVGGAQAKLFVNNGNQSFTDVTADSGLVLPDNNVGATWGDYDKDGDIDLVITHWTNVQNEHYAFLWRNNGDGTFTDVSLDAGIPLRSTRDKTFTPTFADIDNDGWQDLLMVTDNGNTRVYRNNGDATFSDITDFDVITDNAGMGSAVGDYDNDGDLDWFVTAISYRDGVESFGSLTPGNRFYQNQGDGTFVDVTDETGTRHGYWGWAACFSDLNNDSHLDIFHVNGMLNRLEPQADEMFNTDPSRLFVADGNGAFTEQAVSSGIDDTSQGRGIVCFDYDRDGDQDLFVANYNEPPKLFCNTGTDSHFLNVRLIQQNGNTQALGARIYVTTGDTQQFRELRAGNNYVSQNPVEAHFGLGQAEAIDALRIVWPDGEESIIEGAEINQFLTITRSD